jgi:AmmeMemoRadiSam system protein B
LEDDAEEALRRAETSFAACSAGAVLACLGFARERRSAPAELIAYATSADVCLSESGGIPDSFVGYAALSWR